MDAFTPPVPRQLGGTNDNMLPIYKLAPVNATVTIAPGPQILHRNGLIVSRDAVAKVKGLGLLQTLLSGGSFWYATLVPPDGGRLVPTRCSRLHLQAIAAPCGRFGSTSCESGNITNSRLTNTMSKSILAIRFLLGTEICQRRELSKNKQWIGYPALKRSHKYLVNVNVSPYGCTCV